MKPPFTYFGGKLSVAEQIVAFLPAHEGYVEPFAGSLAVLLAKPPSQIETVNDLDGDLMTFWRVLRDRPGDLERACALTPHSRAEHEAAYGGLSGLDDLERARRVWVILTQGRAGQMKRTGWRYYVDPRGTSSPMTQYLAAYVARIPAAAARLASVSLECLPALDIIAKYGQHAANLIYADPPYPASVRTLNHGRCRGPDYAHELRTDEAHRELAGALRAARAAVVLSGYACPLYDELYQDWHRAEIGTLNGNTSSTAASSRPAGGSSRRTSSGRSTTVPGSLTTASSACTSSRRTGSGDAGVTSITRCRQLRTRQREPCAASRCHSITWEPEGPAPTPATMAARA
jgi:DNA adenine methylase